MKKIITKKIEFISLVIIFSITFAKINELNMQEDTLETVSMPASNKVVIIDAGHGGSDGGANINGINEADINLKIALKLQKILEQTGTIVILTRSDENAMYNLDENTLREKKISDSKNRVKLAKDSNADILISIHLNKIEQNKYNGWQCFYRKNDNKSKKISEKIQKGLNQTLNSNNKRTVMKIEDIYLVEHTQIPISIVECGFLSNKEEFQKLQQDDYQSQLAFGIYNGINEYFQDN